MEKGRGEAGSRRDMDPPRRDAEGSRRHVDRERERERGDSDKDRRNKYQYGGIKEGKERSDSAVSTSSTTPVPPGPPSSSSSSSGGGGGGKDKGLREKSNRKFGSDRRDKVESPLPPSTISSLPISPPLRSLSQDETGFSSPAS